VHVCRKSNQQLNLARAKLNREEEETEIRVPVWERGHMATLALEVDGSIISMPKMYNKSIRRSAAFDDETTC